MVLLSFFHLQSNVRTIKSQNKLQIIVLSMNAVCVLFLFRALNIVNSFTCKYCFPSSFIHLSIVSKMLKRVNMDVFFKMVNGLCLVAFFLQMTYLIVDIIYPEVTNTFSYQLKLHQMDFPVLFKLCTSPGFDHQKLVQFGYLVMLFWTCEQFLLNLQCRILLLIFMVRVN